MGVPSFFRWLMKRYPHVIADCVEEADGGNDEHALGKPLGPNPSGEEYDALYLDMNGIIHRASHPEDQPAPENEEAMMQAMFVFIDRLFNIVRPRKLLFIGIDGVAPRAKMNQQRSRRFLAAKHRLEQEEQAKTVSQDAESRETKSVFDHNVITPGTEFMSRVADALRKHIAQKTSNDANWKQLVVILSDACVPGEGEHKIMEFIRYQRTQPGYNPNANIAVYGLDADLIFLTLAQHEPRFSIIREEVSSVTCFVCHKMGHISTDCPTLHPEDHDEDEVEQPHELKFQWLHTHILREYLDREFRNLPLSFAYSLERVVDDFIIICFLAGNDFLPRLPSVAIHEGAIDQLIAAYKRHLPELDGYICSSGSINFKRLEPILCAVADDEEEVLIERRKNFIRRERQERAFLKELKQQTENSDDSDDERHHGKGKEVRHGHVRYRRKDGRRSREDEATDIEKQYLDEYSDNEDEEDEIRIGQKGWRDRYVLHKFGAPLSDHEYYKRVVRSYVEGLQWVACYYWQGCVSWKWYYPYHYPPMATMLVEIGRFKSEEVISSFQLSTPFHPFEQLMAVLPAASAHALPEPYRVLMTSPHSPIADFYPVAIEIDMEGVNRNFEWAGVVKLPFVDESRLLEAIKPLESQLSAAEVTRNSFGLPRLFVGPKSPVYGIRPKLSSEPIALTMVDGDGFLSGSVSSSPPCADGEVIRADYTLPTLPKGFHFSSGLLPGVELPEQSLRSLEEDDQDNDEHEDRRNQQKAYGRGRGGRGRSGRGHSRGGRVQRHDGSSSRGQENRENSHHAAGKPHRHHNTNHQHQAAAEHHQSRGHTALHHVSNH